MSSIDDKISCDRCGEYNHERSMVFHGTTAMCIGCDDEVEKLDSNEDIFFPCDECGTVTPNRLLDSVITDQGPKRLCPMCYCETYEDPCGVLTEYTISYLEVIKHEVEVTAMSREQAERVTLSGEKPFALRTTRLPQTIGKSIVMES